MSRNLPDYFTEPVRRSAQILFSLALHRTWPGLESIWGDITHGGFYFDFRLPHPPPFDFTERSERAFEIEAKAKKSLRPLKRMQGNAADWFALKGQNLRAEIIRRDVKPFVDLAAIDQFLEPCSGQIAAQVPPMEISVQTLSSVQLSYRSQKREAWRLQALLFSSRQSKAQFASKSRRLVGKQLTHQQLGQSLGFFELSDEKEASIWLRRGIAARNRLMRWWTALQRKHDVEIFSQLQIEPSSANSRAGGPHLICKTLTRIENERAESFNRTEELSSHCKKGFSSLKAGTLNALRAGSWQLIDSEYQPGQLEGVFSQKLFWADETHVFCEKGQILVEFNSAMKLLESASSPFGLHAAWSITGQGEHLLSKALGKEWENRILADLRCLTTWQTSAAPNGLKAQFLIKSAAGVWRPSGWVHLSADQRKKDCRKTNGQINNKRLAISYSILGNFERYIALILEGCPGQLPTWFAAASLLVITPFDDFEVACLKQDFATCAIDAHFLHCTSSAQMQKEMKAAFMRGETFIATAKKEGDEKLSMRLYNSKKGDLGPIDAKSYLDLADRSFFSDLKTMKPRA